MNIPKVWHIWLCLFITFTVIAQKKNSVTYIENMFNTYYSQLDKSPIDTTFFRLHKLLYYTDSLSKNDALVKNSPSIDTIKNKVYMFLINVHNVKQQIDSARYYYDVLKQSTVDAGVMSKASYYIYRTEIQSSNYVQALTFLENALVYAKQANNTFEEILVLYELQAFYNRIGETNDAKEINTILNTKLQDSLELSIKNKILLANGLMLYSEGKYAESNKALRKITEFKKISHKITFNSFMALNYLELDSLNLAEKYLTEDIGVSQSFLARLHKKNNRIFALLHFKKGDYDKALAFINENMISAMDPSSVSQESYSLLYELYKKKGDTKKALDYLEKFKKVTDSINNDQIKTRASIKSYKLSKEYKIEQLQKENTYKDKLMHQNTAFWRSILIIIILVIIIVFLVFYFMWKKNKLMLKTEKEIVQAKRFFLENLSHEIRTPITISTGYLSLIKQHPYNHLKLMEYIDASIKNNTSILNSLNAFLELSKLYRGEFVVKKETKVMYRFVEDVVHSFFVLFKIKNMSLFYKSNIRNDVSVKYDYESLKKIINNLLSNALKYSKEGTSVYVSFEIEKNHLVLKVRDEGIGISKKEQKFIFSRFYQSKKNISSGGFGIGLSLVYKLVSNLQGAISVESEENVGTLFTVTLPYCQKEALLYMNEKDIPYKTIVDTNEYEEKIDENQSFPKALIIDDNAEMILYFKQLLASTLNCTFCFNGAEALEKVKQQKFDIVISDYKMPIMDGIQFKTKLNQLDGYNDIPFIFITATPTQKFFGMGLTLGINDCITKPFENSELLIRISTLLENNMIAKKINPLEDDVNIKGYFSNFLEKINSIIIKEIKNSNFTISDLAKECGYSQRQLGRIVQSKTGLTPSKLVLEVRLLKAYESLQNREFPTLNEVVYEVGFSNRNYFNKKFKDRFGVAPSKFFKESNKVY